MGIAGATLVIYPLLLCFVASPLTEDNSGRREAQFIKPLIDDSTCVVSYGKYSASLVFYSGAKIYRLETREEFDKLRPQKMTWTSKNVMPFMTFDELPADKKIVAVVNTNDEKNFFDNAAGNWELVGEVQSGTLESLAEKFFNGHEQQKRKSKIYRRQTNGDNR